MPDRMQTVSKPQGHVGFEDGAQALYKPWSALGRDFRGLVQGFVSDLDV